MKTRQKLELKVSTTLCEHRSFRLEALEIKANEDGTIEGYGSVFGVVDSWNDIIAPGAFKNTLAAHKAEGTLPAMLWQHKDSEPIGIWTEMVEDAKGLRLKGKLALGTVKGKEAHELVKLGALNGLSVGFITKQYSYDNTNDIRTLLEVDLWEVSLVTFPANGKARVTDVKSSEELATPKDAEHTLREAGFSKAGATAFVSRVMRMGEERRESANSTADALKAAQRLLDNITSS